MMNDKNKVLAKFRGGEELTPFTTINYSIFNWTREKKLHFWYSSKFTVVKQLDNETPDGWTLCLYHDEVGFFQALSIDFDFETGK